uniref:GCR044 n=1 Tax=Schmidtea mediterranea TaxID=79327 RepID=A0A193KUI4_SCHMD|nr:GCR044 [Schmidtea mediterranea]
MYEMYKDNLTDKEFISLEQGPQRDPINLLIPFNTIYVVLIFVGVFGNCITCRVILHFKVMRTPTNYYLLNLGIADLSVLILGLTQDFYLTWSHYPYPFGNFGCIVKSLLSEMGMCTSVLTATGFTIERYIAICHPLLKPSESNNRQRTIKIIACIWITSFLCSLPLALQMGLQQLKRNDSSTNFTQRLLEDSTVCTQIEQKALPNSFLISFIIFFLTPLILMSVLYMRIGLTIRHSVCRGEQQIISSAEHKRRNQMRARKAAVKMLAAIVILFFLCLAPFHAERLMVTLIPESAWDSQKILWRVHEFLYSLSGILYYFNCAINPILYNIMSHKFRNGFCDIVKCRRLSSTPKIQMSLSTKRYMIISKEPLKQSSIKKCQYIFSQNRSEDRPERSECCFCVPKYDNREHYQDSVDAFNVTINSIHD